MPSRSKQKGNRFEREVTNIAKEYDIDSQRAYASNGLSLGHSEEVDVLLKTPDKDWRVQCKVRKNIANWIKPDSSVVDLQVVKEDRGQIYAILPYEDFLNLIADDEEYRDSGQEKIDEERDLYRERVNEIENDIRRL
tara:strand:- start:8547 stop:8957 length:411 start_codon:yes stop_codon:yes gene_type:complete